MRAMASEEVALVISSISVLTGLTTLGLVIRNELRERRKMPPVVWGLHRIGTATVRDAPCEAAELVQYGRMPTRLINFTPVGFQMVRPPGPEYRVRAYVKAEDTMPIFINDIDPDNAWVLLCHRPRDDTRWLYFTWVPLDPTSEEFEQQLGENLDRLRKERGTWHRRVQQFKWRVWRRSMVVPVGPTGFTSARIRADGKRQPLSGAEYATILSLATAQGGTSYTPY